MSKKNKSQSSDCSCRKELVAVYSQLLEDLLLEDACKSAVAESRLTAASLDQDLVSNTAPYASVGQADTATVVATDTAAYVSVDPSPEPWEILWETNHPLSTFQRDLIRDFFECVVSNSRIEVLTQGLPVDGASSKAFIFYDKQ